MKSGVITKRCSLIALGSVLCLLAGCEQTGEGGSATREAKAVASGSAATTASLPSLPDWSGWWTLASGPAERADFVQPEYASYFRPEVRERLRAMLAGVDFSVPGSYCQPARFVGFNGGARDAVEFLLTSGRLTIDNESGLLRRIETDGRKLPDDPEYSNAGTSVGHWEGQTLVVHTIAIDRNAGFPGPAGGNPAIGKDVEITERMFLNDKNLLEIDMVMTAPELLSRKLSVKRIYRRDPGHVVLDHDMCSSHDRTIDPATGKQRFDMTPPPDLAPPPPLPSR